jgi:hypothetical protein
MRHWLQAAWQDTHFRHAAVFFIGSMGVAFLNFLREKKNAPRDARTNLKTPLCPACGE